MVGSPWSFPAETASAAPLLPNPCHVNPTQLQRQGNVTVAGISHSAPVFPPCKLQVGVFFPSQRLQVALAMHYSILLDHSCIALRVKYQKERGREAQANRDLWEGGHYRLSQLKKLQPELLHEPSVCCSLIFRKVRKSSWNPMRIKYSGERYSMNWLSAHLTLLIYLQIKNGAL